MIKLFSGWFFLIQPDIVICLKIDLIWVCLKISCAPISNLGGIYHVIPRIGPLPTKSTAMPERAASARFIPPNFLLGRNLQNEDGIRWNLEKPMGKGCETLWIYLPHRLVVETKLWVKLNWNTHRWWQQCLHLCCRLQNLQTQPEWNFKCQWLCSQLTQHSPAWYSHHFSWMISPKTASASDMVQRGAWITAQGSCGYPKLSIFIGNMRFLTLILFRG